MMINKAKFMIVISTTPKKSRYVIFNNIDSTILTTSLCVQSHNQKLWNYNKGGNALRLFSFPVFIIYNISFKKQANRINFYKK